MEFRQFAEPPTSGFGIIPLSVAVVLHEGSTVVVVLNALRLLCRPIGPSPPK